MTALCRGLMLQIQLRLFKARDKKQAQISLLQDIKQHGKCTYDRQDSNTCPLKQHCQEATDTPHTTYRARCQSKNVRYVSREHILYREKNLKSKSQVTLL